MLKRWLTRKNLIITALCAIVIVILLERFVSPGDSIQRIRESLLRQDLKDMRDAIDQYTVDKNKAPQTLQDLVSANYLKEIPKDPMTGSVAQEDKLMAIDQQEPGIDDVHSGSHEKAQNGTPYDTW